MGAEAREYTTSNISSLERLHELTQVYGSGGSVLRQCTEVIVMPSARGAPHRYECDSWLLLPSNNVIREITRTKNSVRTTNVIRFCRFSRFSHHWCRLMWKF